jgi:hypothetical protein
MTIYQYLTAEKTYHEKITGKHGEYPGSGFIVDLNSDSAKDTIELLRQTRWLDVKTRAVYVEFMFYSADLDAFGDTRVLFEMLPSGAVVSTVTTNAVTLERYGGQGFGSILRVMCMVFVYLTVVYYILDDLDKCRISGLAKYK